jgi:uncharacterized heparinase superfamily protein
MSLMRLLRTVVHLKPVQVYGRGAHLVFRPSPQEGAVPPLRRANGPWVEPAARSPALLAPARVRFLNRDGEVESPAQWNDPARDKLWLYNLHYFDDLNAANADERTAWHRALVRRWIAENPPGQGNGWEPYPTSLRIVNWIKWFLRGAEPQAAMLASLAVQARWLSRRVEWHLLGNHLLANAKALIFAGLFFDGPEAEAWLAKGLDIYRRQLAEQVLPDGGHFERSPMYHAIILEDLLDVLNLVGRQGIALPPGLDLEERIERMRAWLRAMCLGDGRIVFFNDAAFGIAAEPGDLEAYALRLGLPPMVPPSASLLHPSGYVRLADSDAVVLADVAPVGPDYLPGHAHADTLSFEMSLADERVVVNGGTSVYGTGPQRLRERATAAHSTVEIDGESSSEVWSGFRVGRRARVRDVALDARDGLMSLSAAHDGYAWRPGRPTHRRTWRMRAGSLAVEDNIEGRAGQAVARFHLGPGATVNIAEEGGAGDIVLPSGRVVRWTASEPVRIEKSEWHPGFGLSIDTQQIVIPLSSGRLTTVFEW